MVHGETNAGLAEDDPSEQLTVRKVLIKAEAAAAMVVVQDDEGLAVVESFDPVFDLGLSVRLEPGLVAPPRIPLVQVFSNKRQAS